MSEIKTATVTKKKTVKNPKKKANPLDDVMNLIKNYNFKDSISLEALNLIESNDFNKDQLNLIKTSLEDFNKIFNSVDEKIKNIKEKEAEENYYEEINEQIKEYINEINDKKLKTFLKSFKMISCNEEYAEDEEDEKDGDDIIYNLYHLDFNLINKKGIEIQFEKDYTEITKSTTTIYVKHSLDKHIRHNDCIDKNFTKISIDTPNKKYENLKEFCDDYKLDKDKFKSFIIFICDEIFDNHGYKFDYDF